MTSEYRAYEEDSAALDPKSPFFLDHVARYWWAAGQVLGADVLDCACGKGYGSFILASRAKSVCGVDMNETSLEIAARTFQRPGLEYKKTDILSLESLGRRFDRVVAFEVIEHIRPEDTDRFLSGIRKALRPGGKLLLSTPNHDVVTKSGSFVPEFHINNFRPSDLRKALRRHFSDVRMMGQFTGRKGAASLVFDVDFLNLRHVLGTRLKKVLQANAPTAAIIASSQNPRGPVARDLFENPYPGVEAYRFSARHWRQAGLTVAECS